MSEINIQRKSGSNVMWWILGIAAMLIIGWLLFANMGTDREMGQVMDPGGPAAVMTMTGTYVI